MYVHKTELRGRDPTGDFTTIQSDERWTPRAPSLKHAWLRNPFSVIYPWSQIKAFLTCEGKLKRGHICAAVRQSTHSATFAPPRSLHTPQINPCYLSHWHCNILLSTRSMGWAVREGAGQPLIPRFAKTNHISVGNSEKRLTDKLHPDRSYNANSVLYNGTMPNTEPLCQHHNSQQGHWKDNHATNDNMMLIYISNTHVNCVCERY